MTAAVQPALPTGTLRLDSLTGVRFAAALGVFALHAAGAAPEWVRTLVAPGNAGVCLFFVLSGFVLAWTARARDRRRDFYRRRVARVMPNHVLVWALVLVVLVAGGVATTRSDPAGAVAALLLVQAWVPDQDVVLAVNGPSWTLSCEAFFYLVFPFLLPVLQALGPAGRNRLVLALAVGLPVWVTLAAALADGDRELWLTANLPPVRLVEFAVGIVVALQVRDGRWRVGTAPALLLTGAALAACAVVPDVYATASVTMVPFAVLIAALAHADLTGRRTPFRSRAVVRLGVWSYAFYLVHEQVLRAVRAVADVPWWQSAVVSLVLATAAAAALYRLVEHPAEARLRGRGRQPA